MTLSCLYPWKGFCISHSRTASATPPYYAHRSRPTLHRSSGRQFSTTGTTLTPLLLTHIALTHTPVNPPCPGPAAGSPAPRGGLPCCPPERCTAGRPARTSPGWARPSKSMCLSPRNKQVKTHPDTSPAKERCTAGPPAHTSPGDERSGGACKHERTCDVSRERLPSRAQHSMAPSSHQSRRRGQGACLEVDRSTSGCSVLALTVRCKAPIATQRTACK